MKLTILSSLTLLLMNASALSDGWQNITPGRLQRISGFNVFDKASNEFDVFCWDSVSHLSPFGYGLSRFALRDSFVSFYGTTCGFPFPSGYGVRRVASLAKPRQTSNDLLILYDDSGCPGPEGWLPVVAVCLNAAGRVPNSCQHWMWGYGAPECAGRTSFIYSPSIEPNTVYVIASDSIFRSSDGGTTFRGLRRLRPLVDRCCIDQFFVTSPGIYLAGGRNTSGQSYALYRSTDTGQTWAQVFDKRVRGIVNDSLNPNVVYVSSDSGLYRSETSGLSWSRIQAGSFRSIRFGRTNTDYVYAGTATGELWRSTDRGNTWSAYNNSFTRSAIIGLYAYSDSDTLLACATNGLFKVFASHIVGVSEEFNSLPRIFVLAQNYPNPFNPTTTINYQLSTNSHVTLKVFDVLGREVATLVNETKEPGRYEVEFNAEHLASGIYLYRLTGAGFTQTKKMILIR
jgi:photosystem II stability/assembly factor-like uncharacterized protein